MMRTLTPSEAAALLKQHIDAEGSQLAFATANNVSQTALSLTLTGTRSMPPSVAAAIGLEKRVVYVPKEPEKKR